MGSDDGEPMTEEQQHKAIEKQFDTLYSNDPKLRKALENSDVANFHIAEKMQIIEAYIQGGGADGL